MSVSEVRHELDCIVHAIDEELGQGYAAEHPELVGALMKAAATRDAAEKICEQIRQVAFNINRR